MKSIKEIIQQLIKFRNERDWKQFHNSKDLAIALSIESAELNELFLWKSNEETESIDKERLEEELADVFSFAFLLAEKHDIDVGQIIERKLQKNSEKYPIDKAKGKSTKYTEL